MSDETVILPLHLFDTINLRDPLWRAQLRAPETSVVSLFGAHHIGNPTLTNLQAPFTLAQDARAVIQNWYATTDQPQPVNGVFAQWAHWTVLTIRVGGLVYATRSVHDLLLRKSGEAPEPLSDTEDNANNEMLEHRTVDDLARKLYRRHERKADHHGYVDFSALPSVDRQAWMDAAAEARKELCIAPRLHVEPRTNFCIEVESTRTATERLLASLERDAQPAAVWIHLEGFFVFEPPATMTAAAEIQEARA